MSSANGPTSGLQRSLRYLLAANIDPQWRDWLATLAPALVEELGEARAWAMLRRTGAAVARGRPLAVCTTVGALEACVLEELAGLNWGWARLASRDEGIDIVHGAYPLAPAPADPAGGWFAAVLEGLYTEWLFALSRNADLTAVLRAGPESVGDVILLSYGRHGQLRLPF